MRDWPDTRVERTRAVGDPPGEAWRRRRDHAAIVDRARGYARQAQRHDAAQHDRALSKWKRAGHLVAMEVAWVDCLVWTLRALITAEARNA